MKYSTIPKAILYSTSLILASVAIYLFLNYSINTGMGGEDIGETTGILLGITMSFEILLFFGLQALKRRLIPHDLKKYFVFFVKYLREYHRPIGSLALGILLLHYAFTFDPSNPFAINQITGYATSALVALSLGIGLFYRLHKKAISTLHLITAFIAIIPFLIHLAN